MRSSREKLAIQKMEILPVPRPSTILPPPLKLQDAWDTLAALRADDGDDFGSSDPTDWACDANRTDVEDLIPTIPASPSND
jgi:hypothetical protein